VLCGIELDCFGVNQKERKSWAVCRALRWEQDEWGRWFKRESLPKQIQEDHRLIDVMAVQFSDMRRDEKKAKIWKRYEERKVEFLENMQSEENEEDDLKNVKEIPVESQIRALLKLDVDPAVIAQAYQIKKSKVIEIGDGG
jgi:hypothetical protein